MSEHPVRVSLVMGDHESFAGSMRAARSAAQALARDLALMNATWEPHDWRDF